MWQGIESLIAELSLTDLSRDLVLDLCSLVRCGGLVRLTVVVCRIDTIRETRCERFVLGGICGLFASRERRVGLADHSVLLSERSNG